ncbi:hypothetical protein AAVH_21140, partial [Aphelenchoides avenae]
YAVWSSTADNHDCYDIAYHWHWTHGTYDARHWTYSANNRHAKHRCYNDVDRNDDDRHWDHRVNADPADHRNWNNRRQHDDNRDWYDRNGDDDGVDWNRWNGHGDHDDGQHGDNDDIWNRDHDDVGYRDHDDAGYRDHNDAGYRDHNDAGYGAHDHAVHDVDYTEHSEHPVAKRHDSHAYADDDETELLWNLERLGGDVALQGLVWRMLDSHDDKELHNGAHVSLQYTCEVYKSVPGKHHDNNIGLSVMLPSRRSVVLVEGFQLHRHLRRLRDANAEQNVPLGSRWMPVQWFSHDVDALQLQAVQLSPRLLRHRLFPRFRKWRDRVCEHDADHNRASHDDAAEHMLPHRRNLGPVGSVDEVLDCVRLVLDHDPEQGVCHRESRMSVCESIKS